MKKYMRHLAVLFALSAGIVCVPKPSFPTVTNTVVSTTTALGTGSQTTYSIGFAFLDNSWINVVRWDTSTSPATSTTIVQGSGASKFTVSGGNPGVSVVMGTAPTTTQYLVITRNIPLTQTTAFSAAGIFPYQGLSNQLDQVTMTLQNLNAGIGGGSGGGGGGGSSSSPTSTVPYSMWGWDAGDSVVTAYPATGPLSTNDILQFNGSGWTNYNLTGSNIASLINSFSTNPISAAAGGTGVANNGASSLNLGTHGITFTTTGTTTLTLPTTGTVVTGTVDNNNTANAIVKRDGSGNFTAGTVTANLVGNVTGNVSGTAGSATGTAANVTGTVAIGHGGSGQTTQQTAINALTNTSGASSNTFLRYDGANATLDTIKTGDVPQGFSRSKLAMGTANVMLVNDGSGNMSELPAGTSGNCAVSNGVKWTSAVCPGGGGGSGIAYGTDSGTANTYVVASTSSITLTAGQAISFIATNANSGASTLNAGGTGVVAIKNPGLGALVTGDILLNQMIVVEYDGTEWVMVSPQGLATNANTANAMVKRDASGNFAAGTITANLTGTASNVTTNANLTGPITSTGNATAVAAQTGTGTTFVMQASPTLTTPVIGAATGTSLSVSGQLTSTVTTGTAPLVVSSTTQVANLNAATAGSATTATTATNATNGATVAVSNSASYFPLFAASSSNGNQPFNLGTGLTFNPNTNALTTTTFVGALTGTASTATNLAGGLGGQIPYQSAAGTTALLANGSAGQVLQSNGTTLAPTWINAPTANEPYMLQNLGFATSVAASALTINLKQSDGSTAPSSGSGAVTIAMRSSTAGSGLYNLRTVTGALSIAVSSGATLGVASTTTYPIYVYALDNAGTVELAVSSSQFDEGKLYSTTIMNSSATSDGILYSTTARTSVPIRLLARMISSQTTAGTWAAVPTTISLAPFKSPLVIRAGDMATTRVTTTPANLGEYESQLRTGATQAWSNTNGSPTATSFSADGFRAYSGGAFAATDTTNQPTKYIIYLGKNKNVNWQWYASSGRTGFATNNIASTANSTGYAQSYDPTTGLASIASVYFTGTEAAHHSTFDLNGVVQENSYFDLIVSDNLVGQ